MFPAVCVLYWNMTGDGIMVKKRWFLKRLLFEAMFLLSTFALGLGITAIRAKEWMPSLISQADMLCAEGDRLFVAGASRRSSYLVETDTAGKMHSCVLLAGNQAFRAAVPGGALVFAVLDTEEDGILHQSLVSFPRRDGMLKEKVILEHFPQTETEVIWSGIAFSEDTAALYLTGIDELGQAWQMTCTPSGGVTKPQRILAGEQVYRIQPAANGDFVWIGQDLQVGQMIGGRRRDDLLRGLAETPQDICFSGERCFISDSISGSVFEVQPDGAARLYCSGTEEVGNSGYPYQQMGRLAAASAADGRVHIVGLLRTPDGSIAAGRAFCFDRLEGLRVPLLWAHGWRLAVICWMVFRLLAVLVTAVFCSHRLAVRLCAGELLICLVLMGVLTAVQYPVYRASLHENMLQTLSLMGDSLAGTLEAMYPAAGETDPAELEEVVPLVIIAPDGGDYEISVFWRTAYGTVVGYDEMIPFGYLAGDVKPQAYAAAVSACLENGVSGLYTVRSGTHSEVLYVEPFSMCGMAGCIAFSRCMQGLEAEQWKFLLRVLPVLAFGLALMGALVLLTRRLLWPLDSLRQGLEVFYARGGR